jgi:hypothetical protein
MQVDSLVLGTFSRVATLSHHTVVKATRWQGTGCEPKHGAIIRLQQQIGGVDLDTLL